MELLQLPPELVLEIMYKLDPASFYICLQTAKLFRQHALASKPLLHAQLQRVPGQRIIPARINNNAEALMQLFGKRANQHLFNSAARMADIHRWHPKQPVDRRISGLLCWKSLSKTEMRARGRISEQEMRTEGQSILAYCEVRAEAGLVTLYSMQDYGVRGHIPQIQYIISPKTVTNHLDFYDADGAPQYKIMKVVTYRAGIAILYAPLGYFRLQTSLADWKLVCFHLNSNHSVSCLALWNIQPKGANFLDLAIDSDSRPVVGWEPPWLFQYDTPIRRLKITRYFDAKQRDGSGNASILPSSVDIDLNGWFDDYVKLKMSVRGKNIDIVRAAADHMPYYTSVNVIEEENAVFERRSTSLPLSLGVFRRPTFGRILTTHHHHFSSHSDAANEPPDCANTALNFVIASDHDPFCRHGPYLVKALQWPDGCSHFDWDVDVVRQRYLCVARLIGFPDMSNLSTLGLIVAVSPRSHRIAVASWKTLLVYSLDPRAFLDPDYSLSRSLKGISSSERAAAYPEDQTEECGWEFYSNAEIYTNCVGLEPVELECEGVVHGLEWRNENELWGWDDQGLVRWKIGAMAKGARGHEVVGGNWMEAASWMQDVCEHL